MIPALIILSLAFYQNTYTYESGLIQFETGKTYVLCQDSFETSCHPVTDKTLKKPESKETMTNGKADVTKQMETANAKPESHRKITLPIIEDMKKFQPEQKEVVSLMKDSIRTVSVIKTPSKKKASGSPFAIEPNGYYEPDKMDDFMSRIKEDEPSDKEQQVVSRAEVHFMIDDQGLYIGSSDRQTLEALRERYKGHLLRFKGYGLDEDEAQWMILSVMEVLTPGEIEEIQTYRDKNKKLVIVEVLNEI